MKIAVVGSGISGLSAAYYLSKNHQVDLFEKDDHFGGHSHTIDLNISAKKIAVDIGFIVFNFKTYPNLIKFFNENKIEIEKSDMSFSVSLRNTMFEYCGKGLDGIFANRSNLFNLKFLRMFYDIIKFYKKCDHFDKFDENITLGNFLDKEKLSKEFINYHLIPMVLLNHHYLSVSHPFLLLYYNRYHLLCNLHHHQHLQSFHLCYQLKVHHLIQIHSFL